MTEEEWKYPEMKPHFCRAGTFTAWCAGSGDREDSAAAWYVRPDDGAEEALEDARASDGATSSTAQRGVLAAAVGCIESLQPNSTLLLKTNSEYVVNAINTDIARWKADGWKASGPRKNRSIIRRIDHVISDRAITARAVHCPNGDGSSDDAILERLRLRARQCWKRSD